jgi:hypothetical protein
MNKKLTRTLAGAMSLMFMGQVMIFGDGSAQGLLHADTIASAAEAIEGAKNKDQLAKEFEEATKDLGKVDFFDVADEKENGTVVNEDTAKNDIAVQSDEAGAAVQDRSAAVMAASEGDAPAGELTVTGIVKQGVINGIQDKTPIYVRIFDENWNELEYQELQSGDSYTVTASSGSGIYHVKYESDGYLPFYLKDFGTGTYTVGSGDSRNAVTLVPGDTTWNEEHDNEWSDDVINGKDLAYVQSCLGAYRGDSDFNPSMDADGDNIISPADLKAFCDFYNHLADDEYYELPQNVQNLDINLDGVINDTDYLLLMDAGAGEEELAAFKAEVDSARDVNSWVYIYNHEFTGDIIVNKDDYNDGIDLINAAAQKRGRSDNYYAYMDKDDSGTIDNADVAWFSAAYKASGDLDWDHAFKRTLIMQESGAFQGSLNLHDTNLNLNGCSLYVGDCMSFTTDIPKFWSGNQGATLNISNGYLEVSNNLVFRTASPDGWGGNAGQNMRLNGGTVVIGGDFNFGQANCYDTIWMTNSADWLEVYGNWNYITLTDMEGKWTAGNICFFGPIWEVNEASGPKSIYSSGSQVIHFGYEGGKQTVLWDNCETYINNEDGSLNTERTFNFNYKDETGKCLGVVFSPDYSNENYHFRPYLPQYVTNLEDAVPYKEWKYMEDSNGNTIPDIVEKQIAEDPLNVDNAWLEDKYGCSVEEFIKTDNVNADKNKKALVETLSYLYNHYIEPVADAASDYIGKSLNQIVKGNFTDDVTLLGTAGEIVLGIFDLDLVCDLRDITYDIGEWGEIIIGDDEFSWSFAGQSFLDLVGIIPVIGAVKYSDEVGALLKKAPNIYKNSVYKSVAECFTDGKSLKSEDEIAETVTNNLKKTQKQIEELLDDSGKFIDEEAESNYQKYVLRKQKSGKIPRDRIDWKEASDHWKYNSPMARGNEFNKIAEKIYPFNEVNLANGKRLDSYILGEKIISRKATDLSDIEFNTFDKYLSEMIQKYAPGTVIRSNKYKCLNGQILSGKMYLEIPAVNKDFDQIDEYMTYAKKKYDIKIIFLEENKMWDFSDLTN